MLNDKGEIYMWGNYLNDKLKNKKKGKYYSNGTGDKISQTLVI